MIAANENDTGITSTPLINPIIIPITVLLLLLLLYIFSLGDAIVNYLDYPSTLNIPQLL